MAHDIQDAYWGHNCRKIHKIVVENRSLKVSDIAETTGMSAKRVRNILHENLFIEKLYAGTAPRLLTLDQKLHQKSVYKRNISEFSHIFITEDETWVHHYAPESD